MDIFSIIPENFFSLLNSKRKRIYASSIFQVYKIYQSESIKGIDKKIIVDDLTIFLDKDWTLADFETDDLDEVEIKENDIDKTNAREIANYILRKMEVTGWIFIDVDNDYQEILNFTDHAITVIECLLNLQPKEVIDEDNDFEPYNPEEFQGYIFTVWSLLNNMNDSNHSLVLNEVLKNTKQLVNFLRKMDFRIRQYIEGVVDTVEIKDLMDRLIKYKEEIFDKSYNRIKTNDNINKYRLTIVQNLEKILKNEEAMDNIISNYTKKLDNKNEAIRQVFSDINEIIETFNTLDDNISKIDINAKTYINATINKIKFLLNEEDNIVGKLNTMLKHLKDNSNNEKELNKAVDLINSTTTLRQIKAYSKKGLYSGRGSYSAPTSQTIDTSRMENFVLDASNIFKSNQSIYSQKSIRKYMDDIEDKNTNEIIASNLLKYDSTEEEVLKLIYAVIYSNENNYRVYKKDELINHKKFLMVNFTLRKEV